MAGAVVALALKLAGDSREVDLDVFHAMAWFREALATGSLPMADVWAYTPTVAPLVHHEWGTGLVLYSVAVASGWGLAGIAALRLVLYAAIAALAVAACRRRGASWPVAAACAPLALALFAPGLAPVRAQMFTFLFVALLLFWADVDRRNARWWLAAWLLVCAAWVNLHGGFVAGFVLYALHTAERTAVTWREEHSAAPALRATAHLWLGGVAMALLTLATPFGWHTPVYLWRALTMERPLIGEWAPLWSSHAQPVVQVTFLFSVILAVYAMARVQAPFAGLSLLAATGWMAIQHKRFVPLYALVWFAVVPGVLTRTPFGSLVGGIARRRSAVAVLAGVALLAGALKVRSSPPWSLTVPTQPAPPGVVSWTAPAGAVEYLRMHGFRGNLMTPFEAGAYVLWHLSPLVRVGMDSRYEAAYPPGAIEENAVLYRAAPGWQRILARHPTDAVLVPSWSPLDPQLAETLGWIRTYRDDSYSIFLRPDHAPLPAADRRGVVVPARFP